MELVAAAVLSSVLLLAPVAGSRPAAPQNDRRTAEAEYFQPCNDMLKQAEAAATCTP